MEKNENKNKAYNADVTKEDLEKLGERNVDQRKDHKGDDVQLENRERPVDFTGKNLDVPGRTIPSKRTTKIKDEENQLYSQGSGHNDHLEDAENHEK
ncbi:hypothetical protein [Winogradskyella schleiferi]|uniref:hypothetical protein n=1 Tax=Winogradskyella schleiferi TaxID=2686078 RepID=UPI0015BE7CF9|nr:hypothetical protein [Winogradskyella schleiferi]